jgi:hypothetical protein
VKIFYGWVIVGTGIVVTCIGIGAMMSLGIFLQPIAEEMGWSRAGISTAGMLGSYFWLFMGSFGIGLGAVAIAFTFRPPRAVPVALPAPGLAH